MIAIDSNILLRYVLDDDHQQSAAARRLIDDVCEPQNPAFVHEVAIAETVWVMGRKKRVKRAEIAGAFRQLLDNPHLKFRDENAVSAAFDAFEEGPADFAEYLIAAQGLAIGAAPTLTFDIDAGRSPGFELLET